MMSESCPVPSAPRTVTGMTRTPAKPTPATPDPLLVWAATMPAIQVPWPLASVRPFEPSRTDVPATNDPARSGWEPSTPVSSNATTDEPDGVADPYSWSQPILGSDHWSA